MPTCCKSGYAIDDPTDTTDEAALRKALSDFLDSPQCLDESVFGKRGTTTSLKEYLENVIADAIDEIAETAAHLIVDEVLRKADTRARRLLRTERISRPLTSFAAGQAKDLLV